MNKYYKKDLQYKKNTTNNASYVGTTNMNKDLIQFYAQNKEMIDSLTEFLDESQSEYALSAEDIINLLENKKEYTFIPISIFDSKLSPLEAVVQYLREIGYSLKQISDIVNRSNKTIWSTYNNALKKGVTLTIDLDHVIPLNIVSDRNLSAFENICTYMKEELSLSFADIARLLKRNKNTIWTTYNRAKEKKLSLT